MFALAVPARYGRAIDRQRHERRLTQAWEPFFISYANRIKTPRNCTIWFKLALHGRPSFKDLRLRRATSLLPAAFLMGEKHLRGHIKSGSSVLLVKAVYSCVPRVHDTNSIKPRATRESAANPVWLARTFDV